MHDRHSSSGWFGGAFGAALTTAAVIAGIGIAAQGSLAASAQQTTVPQRRGMPPAAASTKPAGTPQHAVLPVRQLCTKADYSDIDAPAVQCTDDIRQPGEARLFVGYTETGHWRTGLFFDLSSLYGADLQKATLTIGIKEKKWCGARVGISGGNIKVSDVKATSYEDSGPTQTINVTSLLKPIVANNGRGFGGFVLTSDAEGQPFAKANGSCLSTINDARLAVDYVK